MPADGSAQLAALGKRLKLEATNGLRLELLRGTKEVAAPLIPAVRAAAMGKLPRTGGLNVQVASQKITVQVRTGARTAGVRLVTRAPDTLETDQGYVRHPTFGRRGKGQWKRQKLPGAAGWWSQTLAEKGPTVIGPMLAVQARVARKIQGLGRI